MTGLLGRSRARPCHSCHCSLRGLLLKAAPRWVVACPLSSGVGRGQASVMVEEPKLLLGAVTLAPTLLSVRLSPAAVWGRGLCCPRRVRSGGDPPKGGPTADHQGPGGVPGFQNSCMTHIC